MHTKPNIIFILIDDMGWKDLGCYGSGFYETPNIDALRNDGMLFTDAYAACPVCSPTRGSILSGKYPARLGITDWIDWGGKLHPARGRVVDVPYIKDIPLSEKTLAHALKSGGYETWHVGKWHLGGPGHYPEHVGFDINIGGCENGCPIGNGYFAPWSIEALKNLDVPEGTFLTDYLTEKTIDLIIRNGGQKPFFLNLWYYLVHTPIQAKEKIIQKYRCKVADLGLDTQTTFMEDGFFPCEHKKNKRITRRLIQSDPVYAAMIEILDQSIGKVLAAVRDIGQEDNTIVIFTSDNGGLATAEGAPTSNAPLAEGKGWMYEGGTREPLLVKWPQKIKAGSQCSVPVTSPDFYPTLLEVAGLDLIPEQHADGVSFLPILLGRKDWDRKTPLFWHYPHYGNQGGTPGASVREGDWKLIEFFEDNHVELYNLKNDIGEEHDAACLYPDKVAHLTALLHQWQRKVTAKIPEKNPKFVPWTGMAPTGRHG